jgi:hypothetical protein
MDAIAEILASGAFTRQQSTALRQLLGLAATISDFNASSRAQTEAMLVAGTNITLTPASSGATRTITIDASGSGGGLSLPVAMAVSSLRL